MQNSSTGNNVIGLYSNAGASLFSITNAGVIDTALTAGLLTSDSSGVISANAYGTNGYILQTTGSGVQWVATSSLGFAAQAPAARTRSRTTTAPASLAALQGSPLTAAILSSQAPSSAGSQFIGIGGTGDQATPAYTFASDLTTGIFHPTNQRHRLFTGGIERARLDASGNFGHRHLLSLCEPLHPCGAGRDAFRHSLFHRIQPSFSKQIRRPYLRFDHVGEHLHQRRRTTTATYADANNIAIGNEAFSNYASSVVRNIAIGQQALYGSSTVPMTGTNNFAGGYQALYSNTSGAVNTAIGYRALYSNTGGGTNNAIGYSVLYSNTTGSDNNGIGDTALYSNTTGTNNNAFGYFALYDKRRGLLQ